MPPPVLPLLLPVPSPRTQPRVPSLGRQGLQAGASLGVCNGGWGYGPLGGRENRASGPDSPCRTGRSQWVSAPFSSGEESTRDCEAGGEQAPAATAALPKSKGSNASHCFGARRSWRGQSCPSSATGKALPRHERTLRRGKGLGLQPGDTGLPKSMVGSPRLPDGRLAPSLQCGLCMALGGDCPFQSGHSLSSSVENSSCEPQALPVPDLQDTLQLLAEAGGGRVEYHRLQHGVHGVQGLQGGQRVVAVFPSHPQETDLNSPCKGRRPTLPGGARERPHAGQAAVGSAACGTGCGQAHGKGAKNEGGKAKPRACPALRVRASLGTGQPGGPRGAQSSSPSAYLVVEGSVQALHVLFWRKAEDTAEAGV